jgi:hypothetical protein
MYSLKKNSLKKSGQKQLVTTSAIVCSLFLLPHSSMLFADDGESPSFQDEVIEEVIVVGARSPRPVAEVSCQ